MSGDYVKFQLNLDPTRSLQFNFLYYTCLTMINLHGLKTGQHKYKYQNLPNALHFELI